MMPATESSAEASRAARISATACRTALFAVLLYPLGLAFYLNLLAPDGGSIPIDFVAFWAAAKLAVQGSAIAAFDWPTLYREELLPSSAAGGYFGWHYPATFHLLIAPLGWFSFSIAFAIYTCCTVAAFYAAIRLWGREAPVARNLTIASPAVLSVVFTGNTSLLWAAAFLTAIHFLMQGKPVLAAAFIALLTAKPQLGLLIPVVLIARREWRSLVWAGVFAIVVNAIPTAVFGLEYWVVFFDRMANMANAVTQEISLTTTMATWYGFVRQVGGGHDLATSIQIVAFLAGAAAVAVLWWRKDIDPDLRIAALCLGVLATAPRAYQYELLVVVVGVLFLARAGIGRSTAGRAWLTLLWLLPVPGRLMIGLNASLYSAPIVTASLAICTVIALRRARQGRPWPGRS